MVSFRNFFSICTTMAVLFFMFQFFQLFKESGNPYDTNEYALAEMLSGVGQWAASDTREADILFFGEQDTEIYNVVEQWCRYTKRVLVYADSLEQMQESARSGSPEMLLFDGAALQLPEQEELLLSLSDCGTSMVFLRLPRVADLSKCDGLKELLGITEVSADTRTLEGIQVFSGFLLGGGVTYKVFHEEDEKLQDLELEMPWFRLGKGTKVYVTGLLDEDEADREIFPPVMWRNNYRGTFVFSVNGEYMTQVSGIGFLDGFTYELQDYTLYPVINAQNATVANFPGFAGENSDRIREIYSRSPAALQQDVMWPGLSALSDMNQRKLTCFFMPQYDYVDATEPSGNDIIFYLQQLKEIGGEAGQTLEYGGGIMLAEKLDRDRAFWQQNDISYCFSACYGGKILTDEIKEALGGGNLPDVRTVVTDYHRGESLISYYNDQITVQCLTGDANQYTYSMDLRRRCLNTALGYSNWLLDMKPALWPETKDDQWENYFDELSSHVGTYWGEKDGFDSTALTESDRRVRSLLNLEFSQSRQGNTITLNVGGVEEAWFLLRTHGEVIEDMQGGDYRILEEDAYLIHTNEPTVQLQLGGASGQTDFFFSKSNTP